MLASGIDIREIQHVCISRTDAIGDVILTIPLAGYLKQLKPDLTITFLCSDYTQDVVRCSTHITEVLTVSRLNDIFRGTLPDAVIHVFPRLDLAKFFFDQKIFYRIGTSHRWFHWIFCNRRVNFSRRNSSLHESELNFHLISPFGLKMPPKEAIKDLYGFSLPSGYFVPHEIEKILQKPYIILHPRSRGSAREWSEENFITLAMLLHGAGYQVLVCGTDKEKQFLQNLPRQEFVIDLMGKLSLKEYIALICGAEGLVAASTGPLHIASMAGIKAAGLYPSLRPMHAGRWGPVGKKACAFFFEKEEGCQKCIKSHTCECINRIEPQNVFEFLVS
ncbi:MAG: glycosyltransferase family 9 protein [Bacteroidia bacterium]|nr:glycosyltransferase family 9 protein [Bacteroidia bacterium]